MGEQSPHASQQDASLALGCVRSIPEMQVSDSGALP